MKNKRLWLLFWVAVILSGLSSLQAETTDKLDFKSLVQQYLPECQVRVDSSGKPQSLMSATGEVLDLTEVPKENPDSSPMAGYRHSPAMDFLGRQKIKVKTAQEAAGVIQLWHMLWRGPDFVQQKLYEARPFDGGWVIRTEHDFTKYPGRIQQMMPYELLVDRDHRVTQFRERCYYYRGSATVYTNTVISVYEREKNIKGGVNYPEVLEEELRKAWEKEKGQTITKP